ncbi:beta/gamma crystallin-related protein [Sphingobacterium deserti]
MLFDQDNFRGNSLTLTSDTADLDAFKNKTSSILVLRN